MDELVKQALAKWPNVPHCYGWLGLDARGNWYMRDDRAQAQGPFQAGGAAKGSLLKHEKLIDFIGRNYEHDAQGQWFFQNGPQRVYVELELSPWVWRLSQSVAGQVEVASHTGRVAQVQGCLLDELGRVYLPTDLGLGLVHTQDVGWVAEQVEQGHWRPQELLCAQLAARYGYVISPVQFSVKT